MKRFNSGINNELGNVLLISIGTVCLITGIPFLYGAIELFQWIGICLVFASGFCFMLLLLPFIVSPLGEPKT